MRILSCLATEHNVWLVALAAVICSVGAWTSLGLFRRARARDGGSASAWVFLGAVAAGSSVWCTHFVAMLAYEPSTPVGYEPGLTALSLLIIIAANLAGFGLGSRHARFAPQIGGAVFGCGVAIMHFTGMAAFSVDAVVLWDGGYVAGSVLWAIAVSALAFHLAVTSTRNVAAAALVAAVVGLHFTGMAAMTILPFAPSDMTSTSTNARQMLAFAVTGVAMLVVGVVWVSHFVDQQMRDLAGARLRHLAESSVDGMLIEQDQKIIEVNAAYEALSGATRDELIGSRIDTAGFSVGDLSEGKIVHTTLTARNGDSLPVEIVAHSETGKPGEAGLRVYSLRDIRPRLEQERRIAKLAKNDALTGLPNRVAFLEHLENRMETLEPGATIALLAIDLNRFKEVNDIQGHAAGDLVLQVLSDRMRNVLREGEFVARLGGDEFVAVSKVADRDGALDLAARLEKQLFSAVQLDHVEAVCGASIGIALYPLHASTATALMNNADLAMYRAKASVLNNICFYEEEMDEVVRVRRRMVSDLREALNRDEFELHYQVQVDAGTEAIMGYEALLRWRHPERGYVPPSEFIPLAEETGLILPIGEWVLRTACAEAATWEKPHRIAVNLSAVQLGAVELPLVVHQILIDTGLSPSRLELETTETSLMKDMDRTVHVLRRLKALGTSIAMDDFGTGYSSLSTLRAFEFDKIKLDKSFVEGIDTDAQASAVMLAVLALGSALSIPVLAEGVETRAQLEFLRSRGCNEIQGYFFGRPAASIQTVIAERAVA